MVVTPAGIVKGRWPPGRQGSTGGSDQASKESALWRAALAFGFVFDVGGEFVAALEARTD